MAEIDWMRVLLSSGASGLAQLAQISESGALNPIWKSMVRKVATNVAARVAAAPASVPASWVSGAGSASVDAFATTVAGEGAASAAATGGSAAGLTGGAAGAGAIAAGALPVVAAVGVWVALGSGYYQAREQFKSENALLGFAQGFVMAVLGWSWTLAAERFGRQYLRINAFDEAMDVIRVNSYNTGLKTGYLAGLVLPPHVQKAYVRVLRKASGSSASTKGWADRALAADQSYAAFMEHARARNVQNSYVISLAAAGLGRGIIKSG